MEKIVNYSILMYMHQNRLFDTMSEARKNTRESAQVYQIARQTISQNGAMKDGIASFLRDFTYNGIS